jgi:small subunit ribosomal protein S6
MKEYELTVLIHPDLEADLEIPLKKVRDLITSNDGEIVKEDIWGKKKLSYKINNEDFAVYVYLDIKLPAAAPLKISNVLNISDEVIRYLLVKADLKGRKALEEAKAATSSRNVSSADKKE